MNKLLNLLSGRAKNTSIWNGIKRDWEAIYSRKTKSYEIYYKDLEFTTENRYPTRYEAEIAYLENHHPQIYLALVHYVNNNDVANNVMVVLKAATLATVANIRESTSGLNIVLSYEKKDNTTSEYFIRGLPLRCKCQHGTAPDYCKHIISLFLIDISTGV